MEEVIDILYGELEEKLSKQNEVTDCARAMAREILKSMAVSDLEDSMSKISLMEEDSILETDDGVLPMYLHLLDKSMSMQIPKNDEETLAHFMDLVAALSVQSGVRVTEAVVRRTILYSKAILERVRKRAVTFIAFLATHISERQGEGSSDLISLMEDVVRLRLKDKCKAVRTSAIQASAPFFDAKYPSEKLLNSMMWNLWHDPSAASRSSAVRSLPLNEMTIEHVVQRIRDSEMSVRVAALQALSGSLDLVPLMSPDTFAEVIRAGFSDRCTATKEAMLSLVLFNWIEVLDYDLLQLLRQVDVISNEDECGVLISEILGLLEECKEATPDYLSGANISAIKASFVRQTRLFVRSIELKESAAPEETFLFRHAHCRGTESLDMLSPENYRICSSLDASELCGRITSYSLCLQDAIKVDDQNIQEECAFHCCQLMDIVCFVSLSEEGSKRHFISFVEKFLTSRGTADGLVDRSISALFGIQRKEIDSFGIVCRVLRRLSREVFEESGDAAWSIVRYLTILAPALESCPRNAIPEDIVVDISSVIAASITDTDDATREVAVNCLGRLGFFTPLRKVLEDLNPTLLEVARNDEEKLDIRSQALLSLCDLAMLSEENLSDDSSSFVRTLETLILDNNSSVVALVGEISMKLLLDGRSTERKLLASLLTIYFDPNQNTMDTDYAEAKSVGSSIRLHQLLSVFFPAFVLKSDLNRDTLVGSLYLALEYSSNTKSCKSSKQGAKFPMLKMTEYIMAISESDSSSVALSVCVQVARYLLAAVSLPTVQIRAFCSFMLQQVTKAEFDSQADVHELNLVLEDLQMIVQDEAALNSLSQVADRLSDVDASRLDDSVSTIDPDSSSIDDYKLTKNSILVDSTNASVRSGTKRYSGRKSQSTD